MPVSDTGGPVVKPIVWCISHMTERHRLKLSCWSHSGSAMAVFNNKQRNITYNDYYYPYSVHDLNIVISVLNKLGGYAFRHWHDMWGLSFSVR